MMNLKNQDDLDRILDLVEADHIPFEFVKAANITDANGNSRTVSPEELDDIMANDDDLEDQGIYDIRFILDFVVIKETIRSYTALILSDIPR